MNGILSRFSNLFLAAMFIAASQGLIAQTGTISVSARGVEAKTLLIYSGIHAPYSMADDLAALKLQLRRISTQIEDLPISQVDPAKIMAADYLVVFCPQPYPEVSGPILKALAQRQNPVLWVGYGADKLERYAPFQNRFKVAAFASGQVAETVLYQNRKWSEPIAIWIPAQILVTNSSDVIMAAMPRGEAESAAQPFAWKVAHTTFFAALPTQTGNCALFGDMLLDFYGANSGSNAICVRIDGYHCRQDHAEFRNLVSNLAEKNRPFVVGVIPAYYDTDKDKVLELDSQPEFVAALRYAQEHGGRLVMQGYLLGGKGRSQQLPEFWDSVSDRPLAEEKMEDVRLRIEKGLNQMFAKGLLPLGWITPQNTISRASCAEVAKYFSTSLEKVQLSDATGRANFAPTAITTDDFGRRIIPENLGMISGGWSTLSRIQARAELIAQLRGTVAMFSFPSYLTDDKLTQALKAVEQTNQPFLDLLEQDNWVQAGDILLLTGKARHSLTLNNARIYWRAFDRKGKLIAEELEPMSATGERMFERRGKGDYETFQINQGKP